MARIKKIYPATLPQFGFSRFAAFAQFSPVALAKFMKLSKAGRAPQPQKLGTKCVCYSNVELHRWLSDPVNYRADGAE